MPSLQPRLGVVIGTRPEAVKLAPIVKEFARRGATPHIIFTGQHRELARDLFPVLGLSVSADLQCMTSGQSLTASTSELLACLGRHLADNPLSALIVQGDTTSAFAGALAAFQAKIPVAHVEAGLRSGLLDNPFPEEANRQLISRLATWHFAPTRRAADALGREGISAAAIDMTGNSGIDALHWVIAKGLGCTAFTPRSGNDEQRISRVLVTMHRRENQGSVMHELAIMIGRLATRHQFEAVIPVHPNPAVASTIHAVLCAHPDVRLVQPLDYVDFVATMADSDLILTDSGGVQEEAPALGKPVLVLRTTTERPEAVEAGCARLVGTDPDELARHMEAMMRPEVYAAASRSVSPYGDGHAAQRIVTRLMKDVGLAEEPAAMDRLKVPAWS